MCVYIYKYIYIHTYILMKFHPQSLLQTFPLLQKFRHTCFQIILPSTCITGQPLTYLGPYGLLVFSRI